MSVDVIEILRITKDDTKKRFGGRRNREVAGVLPPINACNTMNYTPVTGVYGELANSMRNTRLKAFSTRL